MSDTVTITLDRETAQKLLDRFPDVLVPIASDEQREMREGLRRALCAPSLTRGLVDDLEMWARWIGDECAKGMEDTNRLLCAGDLRRAAAILTALDQGALETPEQSQVPSGLGGDDRERLREIAGEIEHLPIEFRRHFDQDGRDARFLRKLAEHPSCGDDLRLAIDEALHHLKTGAVEKAAETLQEVSVLTAADKQ